MLRFANFLRITALALTAAITGCVSAHPRPTVPAPTNRTPAPAPKPPPATLPVAALVREERDVVYGRAGGEDLKLDIYAPGDLPGPLPAVVLIHGGGWCSGSRVDYRATARTFAEHGYVAATVEYRLAPRYKFPAQLEDVKCAVRWLRANAKHYHADPDAIAAMGASAGGHLALLVGMTGPNHGFEGDGGHAGESSKVQAVIDIMGPTDLMRTNFPAAVDKMLADMLDGSRDQRPTAYWAASPMSYVRQGGPPVLTIHGTRDELVPFEQAQMLDTALRNVGVVSVLEPLQGKGHGWDWTPQESQHNESLAMDFLSKQLGHR